MLDPSSGRLLLGIGFEEKLIDFADGQALGQVIEGAMFIPAMVAVAVSFATAGEPFHQGGAQGVGPNFELREEKLFALAQGQCGFGGVINPSHIYGEDMKIAPEVNQKENEFKMRKCL